MKVSVEISLYPLREEYVPVIVDFIHEVEKHRDIEISRNRMSTQIFGDFERVMDILREEMRRSWDRHGKAVLVAKFVPGDVRGAI